MLNRFRIICFGLSLAALSSCKNEADKSVPLAEEAKETVVKENPVLTESDRKQIGSVLVKIMGNPDLKMFSSALVSAGLTDILSKESGPFTVFAPSNAAFQKLPKEKLNALLNPQNSEQLALLLKNHIVEGNFTEAILFEKTKQNQNFKMKTLAGTELKAVARDSKIEIKNASNETAKIESSAMDGNNGTAHVLGVVLLAD